MSPRWVGLFLLAAVPSLLSQDSVAINQPADGYRGIWYFNQESNDEYVYKYSGGLGTYCAKHQPFAVYVEAVNKTFFCYGGTTPESHQALHHMVSFYDHATGRVPRPTILLDKETGDAHDNPVITVDDSGYIWIFSTSHGRSRLSYIHRSTKPYSIDEFERVPATYVEEDGRETPITNFSYMQVWPVPGRGFLSFFTRYRDPAARTSMFMTSPDGIRWSRWQRLAAIEEGHYQISAVGAGKAASAFNYHPAGKGLNWRTNLYYIETPDLGKTWRSVRGEPLAVPLTRPESPALVHDYRAAGLNVYLKDIRFDHRGHPVILYVTSQGYESGPENAPRTWTIAAWSGSQWRIDPITTSDNNYDMGSLYVAEDVWRIIAPTEPGPQRYNPGGEMAKWAGSSSGGWRKERQLTAGSALNHTYARRPVNAHPDFYALWADGHGRRPSKSRLYFSNQEGRVFMLPPKMVGEFAKPEEIRQLGPGLSFGSVGPGDSARAPITR